MLDVQSYIYADVHCGGFREACSSDKPLENNFLFSAGKADRECRKQSSIILPKPKLNQESSSDFKHIV